MAKKVFNRGKELAVNKMKFNRVGGETRIMENKCPKCKSRAILVSFTGCHCMECGYNFEMSNELNFFRW